MIPERKQQIIKNINLINWLNAQELYPKIFWKEKGSRTSYAAVGAALTLCEPPEIEIEGVRFYGGMRFDRSSAPDASWGAFPPCCFWLPQIELCQDTETMMTTYGEEKFITDNKVISSKIIRPIRREETPTYADWQKNIEKALDRIHAKEIDKIVLARKTTLHFSEKISPWMVLKNLEKKSENATLFAFQIAPNHCFLGATPERLFLRSDRLLCTEAIAGTRPRGNSCVEDQILANALLSNVKEKREFDIVKSYLNDKLSPLSEKLYWNDQDQLLTLPYLFHLHNELTAILKDKISNARLLDLLHPTPALGGFPKARSLALLKELEHFDRGWYGSAVGMIGTNHASMHVAIRSLLIEEHSLHLFAGTGIVEGSVAEREWKELNRKVSPFEELFL